MAAGLSRGRGLVAAIVAALAVVACAPSAVGPTFPPIGSTPAPASERTAGAQAQVAAALAVEGIQLKEATSPYRPPEGAIFAAAPRTVVQAILPDDPTHGFIVLYAFGTPAEARAAAEDQARYVASGPGRVQFLPGTQFTLRVLGGIAIFFALSPNSPDARMASIPLALSQIGDEVLIPA